MQKRKIFRWGGIVMLIYFSIGLLLYYFQEKLLFRPVKVDRKASYDWGIPYRELNLMENERSNLNITQFSTSADSLRGVVLYFHGNRNNIGWYARFAPYFTRNGYEVWMIDYPGYGKSTGAFSEQKIYEWALQLYKLARTRFQPAQIILYGKSMGTGIASQLAAVRDCRRLILETPYYDFPSILRPYLFLYPLEDILRYQFPTYRYLPRVTAPITLLHGTADGIVRYSNAVDLLPLLKKGDELVTVPGGSHNDLYDYPMVSSTIDSLLR
jgi:pimeloyl-ACP methyl ester carboxylesterase